MEPSTAHVLPVMSYVVLSSVKSDEKSYIGATATFRPARLLQRLRHHRSSAERRQHGAQHRARIAGHVRDYCSGFDTTGAAPMAVRMEPSTAHVLLETSYTVLNFVKCNTKSQIVARPAQRLKLTFGAI
ncbi:hypothetical protein PF008_g30080 [Phytophthora fragariae]|uniref:Uncharacterized protein n=1 Tax=Phytophthora fragariae TaxID=53985 RepID=A0A6G0Q6P2_9STRA|nr:hypothetical protein PF008_g30080 [Phytophthora fragariae]